MNRREFIKSSAGAFFIASAPRVFGAMAPMNRIRLAIVGCHRNGRGFEVMNDAMQVPGLEIAVVCDVDSRAMDFAADWLVKQGRPMPIKEKDFRKVLEMKDLDGVISETPDHFHAYSAVMAMRAGKHVYVEKPCAFCPEECSIILDTWEKTGCVFQQGSQRRSIALYYDLIKEVREKNLLGTPIYGKCWYMTDRTPIGNGKVIAPPKWLDWDLWQACAPREELRDNVVHYNWHWFRKWGTGECGNNSVHTIDVARWFLGVDTPEKAIVSTGRNFIPQADDWQFYDTMQAAWKFPGGKSITWDCNCCCKTSSLRNWFGGTLVYGSNGNALEMLLGKAEVRLLDPKGEVLREWTQPPTNQKATNQSADGNRTGGGTLDTTIQHLGNFCDCIRDNTPEKAVANAEIGTKSTYLALVANVADNLGGVLRLDPKTGEPLDAEAKKFWAREYAKGWELV